ncbi:CHAT domain-containing protein [Crucibulum laeve]|uniref:CHAT domain-containing protein n=1 Tax=Crucibulum laeve TaxID=68775 RepID=A0A5C3M9K1_9AGAR|nr:CHAT domain-containing protein [Crucibulum laeve]
MSSHPELLYVVVCKLPDKDTGKATFLGFVGSLLHKRFDDSGRSTDINIAILAYDHGLAITPQDHPEHISLLYNASSSRLKRYEHSGVLSDIDEAISGLEIIVEWTLHDDASVHRAASMNTLGKSLMRRFEHKGHLEDINRAINVCRKALEMTPAEHEEMFDRLKNLGDSFLCRFERGAFLPDVEEAIALQRKALALLADKDKPKDKSKILNNLGISYIRRFERTGTTSDLDEGIIIQEMAAETMPDNHIHKPAILSNLGNLIHLRFELTADLTDIDKAIAIQTKAMDLTPEGHSGMTKTLTSLGGSYLFRFKHTGDLKDADKAISLRQRALLLLPTGHADIPGWLTNLGNAYLYRFEHTGDFVDIDKGIASQQRGVDLIPQSHSARSRLLSNLGNTYLRRFQQTNDLADIDNAILVQQQAVDLAPSGHPSLPQKLHNLSNSLLNRSHYTDDLRDIEEAIITEKEAIHLTSGSHPELSQRFTTLGISYLNHYKYTNAIEDIGMAIDMFRKAKSLTAENHLNMPGFLSNLSGALEARFKEMNSHADIIEAIEYQKKAISLTPPEHSTFPRRLSSFGRLLMQHFQQTQNIDDITEAIIQQKKAVDIMPEGNARIQKMLTNLASSLLHRYQHNGDHSDLENTIAQLQRAAKLSVGPPSRRIEAAQKCAVLCKPLDKLRALNNYEIAMNLLPQVAWLGQTIDIRHGQLANISNLSNEAAALAITLGKYETAIEWLEHGRSIVWKQVNSLRSPLDDLRAVNEPLAEEVARISKALECAGTRTELRDPMSKMSQKISLQEEVKFHKSLAQKWSSLLSQVRQIKGFEDFLQPMKFSRIINSMPSSGIVVVINVDSSRCDALALRSSFDVLHIALNGFSHEKAGRLHRQLYDYLSADEAPRSDVRAGHLFAESSFQIGLKNILHDLWELVVQPILGALNVMESSNPPHIWWCATGPLAFLPLHAAGIYSENETSRGPIISDFVVSSYIPVVSALFNKSNNHLQSSRTACLALSQPNTPGLLPIPNTTAEIQLIKRRFNDCNIGIVCLEDMDATVERTLEEMKTHGWLHFACHAVQNLKDPLRSAFYLHDGQLQLSQIIQKSFPIADFAFLSACQTGTGDERLSEEAVHLAAGMLTAGYRGVVATMWSISDDYGPSVADEFYAKLLNSTGDVESNRAAYALRHATDVIRKRLGNSEHSLRVWVPYIHIGL